jgi:hypothetical protein
MRSDPRRRLLPLGGAAVLAVLLSASAAQAAQPPPSPPAAASTAGQAGATGVEALLPMPRDLECGTRTRAEEFHTTAYSVDYDAGPAGSNFINDPANGIANGLANWFVAVVVYVGYLTTRLLAWMFRFDALDQFSNVSRDITAVVDGLVQHFYLPLLPLVVAMAGGWLVVNGLLRRRLTVTLETVIWMVAAMAVAAVFFADPTGPVSQMDRLAVGASNAFLGEVGKADPHSQEFACPGDTDSSKAALRVFIDRYWDVYVYAPWAVVELGRFQVDQNGTDQLADQVLRAHEADFAGQQPDQGTAAGPGPAAAASGSNPSAGCAAGTAASLAAPIPGLPGALCQSQTQQALAKAPPGVQAWAAGRDGFARAGLALLSCGVILAVSLLLLFAVGAILVAQLVLLILTMVAPLFFVVGVFPSTGRRIFLGWAQALAGALLKRVLYAALLAVILVISGVISDLAISAGAYFLAAALEIALVVAAFIYRRPVLNIVASVGSPRRMAGAVQGLRGAPAPAPLPQTANPPRPRAGWFGRGGRVGAGPMAAGLAIGTAGGMAVGAGAAAGGASAGGGRTPGLPTQPPFPPPLAEDGQGGGLGRWRGSPYPPPQPSLPRVEGVDGEGARAGEHGLSVPAPAPPLPATPGRPELAPGWAESRAEPQRPGRRFQRPPDGIGAGERRYQELVDSYREVKRRREVQRRSRRP